jgi:hypothetical protein
MDEEFGVRKHLPKAILNPLPWACTSLGRRSGWPSIGSVEAAQRAAKLMTLVSSAMRYDLHVWAYIEDILDRLLAATQDYESLCPHVWKPSHLEAIRHYRALERRDAADRKRLRRAHLRTADHGSTPEPVPSG